MRGIRKWAGAAVGLLLALGMLAGFASRASAADPGRVFRIGYLEGETSWDYDDILRAIQEDLKDKGWGDRVEFPADAHMQAANPLSQQLSDHSEADAATLEDVSLGLAQQLMARDDLDLIIGMGTVGTRCLLKANNGRTPVVGVDITDPVASGLVKSIHDSGVPNFTTAVVPDRWIKMFRLFHDIVPFKRLGILYVNTPTELVISNLLDAREVAREQGFTLLEDGLMVASSSPEQCLEGVKRLHERGMDAFYVSSQGCFDWSYNDPTPILKYLSDNGIATFARMGNPMVQLGALMGSSSLDMIPFARFHAQQIVDILSGASPHELSMVVGRKLGLTLNIQTAKTVGLDFPMEVLVLADSIVTHDCDLETLRGWYRD